jgi:hypothetical protein
MRPSASLDTHAHYELGVKTDDTRLSLLHCTHVSKLLPPPLLSVSPPLSSLSLYIYIYIYTYIYTHHTHTHTHTHNVHHLFSLSLSLSLYAHTHTLSRPHARAYTHTGKKTSSILRERKREHLWLNWTVAIFSNMFRQPSPSSHTSAGIKFGYPVHTRTLESSSGTLCCSSSGGGMKLQYLIIIIMSCVFKESQERNLC